MSDKRLAEHKIHDAMGVDVHQVSQYTTQIEYLNDNVALVKWTGVKLVSGDELEAVKDWWPEYEAERDAGVVIVDG